MKLIINEQENLATAIKRLDNESKNKGLDRRLSIETPNKLSPAKQFNLKTSRTFLHDEKPDHIEIDFTSNKDGKILTLTINYRRGEVWLGNKEIQEVISSIPLEILNHDFVKKYLTL